MYSPAQREHRPGGDLRLLGLGLVGHVLAAALVTAAVQDDRGATRARSPRTPCGRAVRARSPRWSAAGRRSSHRATWPSKVPSRPRNGRGARALRVLEVVGLRGRAAHRARARAPAGRGARLQQDLRAAARHVADLDGGLAAHRRLRDAADHRRAASCVAVVGVLVALRLRSLGGRVRGREPLAAPASGSRCPRSPVRRRLFWGAEIVFAVGYALGCLFASFAPDVWNTEKPMDMAFINAINASAHFPPHDPWMSGETLNYYYLGHVVLAWPLKLLGAAAGRGLPAQLGPALRADADRGLHVLGDAVGGGARVPRRARAARRPGARRPRGAALVADPRQPRGREGVARRHGPAARLRVVRPVAGDPEHDQRVPVVLVHARRPARARDRAAVHRAGASPSRCRWRCKGPRGDLLWRAVAEALAAGLAIGALYAINSWSYPVAAGILVAAVIVVAPRPAPSGAATRSSWLGARAGRQLRADPAVHLELHARGEGDRRRPRRAGRSGTGSATWR